MGKSFLRQLGLAPKRRTKRCPLCGQPKQQRRRTQTRGR